MTAIRYRESTTTQHELSLIELINMAQTTRVIFFASPVQGEGDAHYCKYDAPVANLPSVSVLVETSLPLVPEIKIVFDGNFLTATRGPRAAEVRAVLDAAEKSDKAYFAPRRLRFTGGLSPVEAVEAMSKIGPLCQLDAASRTAYMKLLQ